MVTLTDAVGAGGGAGAAEGDAGQQRPQRPGVVAQVGGGVVIARPGGADLVETLCVWGGGSEPQTRQGHKSHPGGSEIPLGTHESHREPRNPIGNPEIPSGTTNPFGNPIGIHRIPSGRPEIPLEAPESHWV